MRYFESKIKCLKEVKKRGQFIKQATQKHSVNKESDGEIHQL